MKKEPRHKLNFPLIFKRASIKANKNRRYIKSDYLDELSKDSGVLIDIRTLTNMRNSLPYSVTALKAMAEKAGLTIDEIIKEKHL